MVNLSGIGVTVGGYAAAAVLLWLLIDAKSDVKAEIERCNVEKVSAVQEATDALREAEIDAYEERIAALEQKAMELDKARRIAQEAAVEAQNRPERVRTVVKEVTSDENCLSQPVPAAVIDSLRQ